MDYIQATFNARLDLSGMFRQQTIYQTLIE
jgi:hypothetical protein